MKEYVFVLCHDVIDCNAGNTYTAIVPKNVLMNEFYLRLVSQGDCVRAVFSMQSRDEGKLSTLRMNLYNEAQAAGLDSPYAKDIISAIEKKCGTARRVSMDSLIGVE